MLKNLFYNSHRIAIGGLIGLVVAIQLIVQSLVIAEVSHLQYTDLSLAWLEMVCLMIGAYCGGVAGFATRRNTERA